MLHKSTLLTISLVASASAVQAQEACTTYTIQAGDSLSTIAKSAYGTIAFQTIWDANRTAIGGNPNIIGVGTTLRLPCADGSLPGQNTAAAPAVIETEPEAPADDEPITISLVTGSGYAPFTDESMEGGGIYTQLVRAAMDTVEPKATTSIIFVNDWGSHLETLLPSNAFDGAFPWLRPNCEAPETLTEDSIARCENFLHSDPFYEIIDGLVVDATSPLATTQDYADFHGTTICLPQDYTDALLAADGLVEPTITLSRPAEPEDCIQQLNAGEVQAVSMEQRQASDIITRLGLDEKFIFNPNLNNVSTLAVYVGKDNPDAEQIIALLNEGLNEIRENGVWFNTVRTGFNAYYAQ
ncbi:LysM peptidoglycan-binding domain-containing protein [Yoonia maritima]|uniref:LysM peptidoglycan-binding domain-containing protein n=1 Tax=Yoonia maritima TaxID=1435347 RepID=UPI00373660BF